MAAITDLETLRQAVRDMPAETIFSYQKGHNTAGEAQFYLMWISQDRKKLHYWDLEKGQAPEPGFRAVVEERFTIVDKDADRRTKEQRLPGILSVRAPIPKDRAESILQQDIEKERKTFTKSPWMWLFARKPSTPVVTHEAGERVKQKTGPGRST